MNSDFSNLPNDELDVKLTALLLGELPPDEAAALLAAVEQDRELAALYARLKQTLEFVRESADQPVEKTADQPAPLKLSDDRRQKLLAHFKTIRPKEFVPEKPRGRLTLLEIAVVLSIVGLLAAMVLPTLSKARYSSRANAVANNLRQIDGAKQQWAMENNKSANDVPTRKDLEPYLGRGSADAFPKPVAGETYNIGRVGESPSVEVDARQAKQLARATRGKEIPQAGGQRVRVTMGEDFQMMGVNSGVSVNAPTPAATPAPSELAFLPSQRTPASSQSAEPAARSSIVLPSLNEAANTPQIVVNSGSIELLKNPNAAPGLWADQEVERKLDRPAVGGVVHSAENKDQLQDTDRSKFISRYAFIPAPPAEQAAGNAGSSGTSGNNWNGNRTQGVADHSKEVNLGAFVTDLSDAEKSAPLFGENSTRLATQPGQTTPGAGLKETMDSFQGSAGSIANRDLKLSDVDGDGANAARFGSFGGFGGGGIGGSGGSGGGAAGNAFGIDRNLAHSTKTEDRGLETRTIRMDPTHFYRQQESAGALDLAQAGKSARGGGGGGGGGGGSGDSTVAFVTSTNGIGNLQEGVANFFNSAGVDLRADTGKSFFYNDRDGTLTVRATPEDMKRIEDAVETLSIAPPEVTVKARFAEAGQQNRALGFDWYLGNQVQGEANAGKSENGANGRGAKVGDVAEIDNLALNEKVNWASAPESKPATLGLNGVTTVKGQTEDSLSLLNFGAADSAQRAAAPGEFKMHLANPPQELVEEYQRSSGKSPKDQANEPVQRSRRSSIVLPQSAPSAPGAITYDTAGRPTINVTAGTVPVRPMKEGPQPTISVDASGNQVIVADGSTIEQVRQLVAQADGDKRRADENLLSEGQVTTLSGRQAQSQVMERKTTPAAATTSPAANANAQANPPAQGGGEINFANSTTARITPPAAAVPPPAANASTQASTPGALNRLSFPLGSEAEVQSTQTAGLSVEVLRRRVDPLVNRVQQQLVRAEENKVLANKIVSDQTDAAPAKPALPPPVPQPEVQTSDNAFSTFSLNVSDVSFKLAAASLEKGQLPDAASIRSEEFINAFNYHDPEAAPGAPIAFAWERARYPFAYNRDLLRFSVKTAAAGRQAGRPLNLVLLLDNSGSMERADRVRIIHEALRVLATQLQPQDKLSVVAFSRTARLWVDGMPGSQAGEIADGLAALTPEGGTNLEEAMNLAYATALRHYLANGMNRVVLLTDGAANLGNVDPETLKRKVETNRKQGVALDCFGIGWEGYNDDLLEVLSRNGDGRYGFINSPEEAATEFAGQLAGALKVAASDVKVQVEFNPKRVTSYRQIGYAKHQLTKEQFRDNTVDAAEIAAQEAGNALYTVEVNPAGEGPIGVVRCRYRIPGTTDYREQEWTVPFAGNAAALEQSAPAIRLAATASAFSEWLASSPYAGDVTPDQLLRYLGGVPETFGADMRPAKLVWMIRQAKSISGK